DGTPRGGGLRWGHRAGVAAREVEDGEPVRGDHDADRREGVRSARLPHRRGHRPLGGGRPDGRLGSGLLLPVLPEGRLPRDRAGRRTLVVSGALAIVAAYVIGAVPVGFLVARAFGIGDIRRHGSGTIGATNVLRTAGRVAALATLAGDIAKGYGAVWAAAWLSGGALAPKALCAVAAVVGNCWSVFLGFRGGKGVATGLGAGSERKLGGNGAPHVRTREEPSR